MGPTEVFQEYKLALRAMQRLAELEIERACQVFLPKYGMVIWGPVTTGVNTCTGTVGYPYSHISSKKINLLDAANQREEVIDGFTRALRQISESYNIDKIFVPEPTSLEKWKDGVHITLKFAVSGTKKEKKKGWIF